MEFQPSAILVHNPDLVWRPLQDELVIVRPADGQIRVLNGVGSFVWQALDGENSCAAIAQLVCAEYEVSVEEAEADVLGFLTELAADDLVRLADSI